MSPQYQMEYCELCLSLPRGHAYPLKPSINFNITFRVDAIVYMDSIMRVFMQNSLKL